MPLFEQTTPAEALQRAELVLVLGDEGMGETPTLTAIAASIGLTIDDLRRAAGTLSDSSKPPRLVLGPAGGADVVVIAVDTGLSSFDITAAAARLATTTFPADKRLAVVPAFPPDGGAQPALVSLLHGLAAGRHPCRADLGTDLHESPSILVVTDGFLDESTLRRLTAHAEAGAWARDLVNAAPSVATPTGVARRALGELSPLPGVTCRLIEADQLEQAGFRAVAAVGSSSQHPPCVLDLRYEGAPENAGYLGLCGKGITYDGGGMNVKPAEVQRWMKADMAGGAAVLGALRGVARQRLSINVHAVVPLAENLYGERALRQGDVITHFNGLTTEITHTDAEGRLVLADCLAYMAEAGPTALIDVATLTNWILGPDLWMVLGTDQGLIDELLSAGRQVGEPGWQLPLWPGYANNPTSPVADLQNYDFRENAPDTIIASHYLRRFVGDVPWAHLDIVGTAFRTERGNDGLLGATGSATRTLLTLLEQRADAEAAAGGDPREPGHAAFSGADAAAQAGGWEAAQ